MIEREPFAYVVATTRGKVTLNIEESHRGRVTGHRDGISAVGEVGGYFAIDAGINLLLARSFGLSFVEPREVHRNLPGGRSDQEPLRALEAVVLGRLVRDASGDVVFEADGLAAPPLGAAAVPLADSEALALWRGSKASGSTVRLGAEHRTAAPVEVDLTSLLGRHVAVLGSTGQGKSSFTATVLRQLCAFPNARVVIFDVNGEYDPPIEASVDADRIKRTRLGAEGQRIPYPALGRSGLFRLLLPSERTQRPALAFALEHLHQVEWVPGVGGLRLAGSSGPPVLFDDGRQEGARPAHDAITALRAGAGPQAGQWPPMLALAALAADSHCITQGRNGPERNAFLYGNQAALITRIQRLVDDPAFNQVVETGTIDPAGGNSLRWRDEVEREVEHIFGGPSSTWQVHVVNLRDVAQDLLPFILGALLDLYSETLFTRGQDRAYPTLLVLEEAHHYLKAVKDPDGSGTGVPAYERLAKEGRKFGLSLWVSTQRPSELSPTVLAQCGTWITFRLTSEADQRAVRWAGEWADELDLLGLAGLPKRHALAFGAALGLPARLVVDEAAPPPRSHDPPFERWF